MVTIINVSPHTLNFRNEDGTEFEVAPSGVVINATPVEEVVGTHPSGAELTKVKFESSAEALEAIEKLERENPGAVIVGSMIAAQAFPGRVFGMVAAKGYERRPPAEKRMNPNRYTSF
jgi:hypothetical protein